MDRYQRIEKPKVESIISHNEIRITTHGLIRNYISYATSLLQEKKTQEIVLKAMGQAISKTVATAEIIKRKLPGLYQNTHLSSISITDVWEPIEEGLLPLETTRHVSMITITLSTRPLDETSTGFQAPLPVEPAKQSKVDSATSCSNNGVSENGKGRGSGNGRGRFIRGSGRGSTVRVTAVAPVLMAGRGFDRGRGWSRGRGRGSVIITQAASPSSSSIETLVAT